MLAERSCWWCGRSAEVDTELPESNGLVRDNGTMDGSESWICTDNCTRPVAAMAQRRSAHREIKSAGDTTGGACGGSRLGNPCDEDGLTR